MAGNSRKLVWLGLWGLIVVISPSWAERRCDRAIAAAAGITRNLGPFSDPFALASDDFSALPAETELGIDPSAFAAYRHLVVGKLDAQGRVPATFLRLLDERFNRGLYGTKAMVYLRLAGGRVVAVERWRLHGLAWFRHSGDVPGERRFLPDEVVVVGNGTRSSPVLLSAPFPYEGVLPLPPAVQPFPVRAVVPDGDKLEVRIDFRQTTGTRATLHLLAEYDDVRRLPRSGPALLAARLALLESLPVAVAEGETVRYRTPWKPDSGGAMRVGILEKTIDLARYGIRRPDGALVTIAKEQVWPLGRDTRPAPFTPTLTGPMLDDDVVHVFRIHRDDVLFFRFLDGVARFTSQPEFRRASEEEQVRLLMQLLLAFVPPQATALHLEEGGHASAGDVLLAGVAVCRHLASMLRWMLAESGYASDDVRLAVRPNYFHSRLNVPLSTPRGVRVFAVDPTEGAMVSLEDAWHRAPANLRDTVTSPVVREVPARAR